MLISFVFFQGYNQNRLHAFMLKERITFLTLYSATALYYLSIWNTPFKLLNTQSALIDPHTSEPAPLTTMEQLCQINLINHYLKSAKLAARHKLCKCMT